MNKQDCDKEAQSNWNLAHQCDRLGGSENRRIAEEARSRAIEWERQRDSWLYRTFGW